MNINIDIIFLLFSTSLLIALLFTCTFAGKGFLFMYGPDDILPSFKCFNE